MPMPHSYRILSTSTTSFMCATAILAQVAIAAAHEAADDDAHLVAPIKVFAPASIEGSRTIAASSIHIDYEVVTPFALSQAAAAALGHDGVERLESFKRLRANWDGHGARTLDRESLKAFSEFFRDTDLQPEGVAVFMSREGNITVNWLDADEAIIELEFLADRIHYFFERASDEDTVARADTSPLRKKLQADAA